ncbi:MAG: DUF6134 family protein [Gammaproteobacteria bacterium]
MKFLTGIGLVLSLLPYSLTAGSHTSHWHFAVLLDGKHVGEHQYTLTVLDDVLEVQSDANMRVRFMFFDAYRYQHNATELWQGDCLQSIEAVTIDNNNPLHVKGERDGNAFYIDATNDVDSELPACVKSFAYWDPDIITADKLLNAQTGKLTTVNIRHNGEDKIKAAGKEWAAQRFTLTGNKLHIDLWYGQQGEWLRLRSLLPSGRELDYRLESLSGSYLMKDNKFQ